MSGRLDAHVLEFRPGQAPVWRVTPASLAESEAGCGAGSGPEAVSGSCEVLPESVFGFGVRRSAAVRRAAAAGSRWREAKGPAQQELGL